VVCAVTGASGGGPAESTVASGAIVLSPDAGGGTEPHDEASCHPKILPPVLKTDGPAKPYGGRQDLTDRHPRSP
jgi:hypothetical protein